MDPHETSIKDTKEMPMRYAYLQGKFLPLEDAKISVLTHAFLYGTAVFEGIRAYYNTEKSELFVLRLQDHYRRLRANCRILKMDIQQSVEQLCDLTIELLRKCDYREDVYIRPVAYKSAERIGLKLDELHDLTVFAVPMGSYLSHDRALKVMVSSWRRIEDNAIPARAKINGSYVNLSLAAAEARDNGFDEAILLNEDGTVSEAAGMNLFIVRNGKLITASVTDNVLEGITRTNVFEIASELQIPFEERSIGRSELYVSDEVFFCGTGAEITAIGWVDRRKVGEGQIGPVTRKIQDIYYRAVRGEDPRHQKWLTPVYKA